MHLDLYDCYLMVEWIDQPCVDHTVYTSASYSCRRPARIPTIWSSRYSACQWSTPDAMHSYTTIHAPNNHAIELQLYTYVLYLSAHHIECGTCWLYMCIHTVLEGFKISVCGCMYVTACDVCVTLQLNCTVMWHSCKSTSCSPEEFFHLQQDAGTWIWFELRERPWSYAVIFHVCLNVLRCFITKSRECRVTCIRARGSCRNMLNVSPWCYWQWMGEHYQGVYTGLITIAE